MSQYPITVFNADTIRGKVPISPYGDKTFVFRTFNVNTMNDMLRIMAKYFILNMPLEKLLNPIKSRRVKSKLSEFYGESIPYIILDIDDVSTVQSRDFILEYFKPYKCIIGPSRSYNGIDNFRLKGFLIVDGLTLPDLKGFISYLHSELAGHCTLDEAASRQVTFNAPTGKTEVYVNNEHLEPFKFNKDLHFRDSSQNLIKESYIIENLSNTISLDDIFDVKEECSSIEMLCLSVFQNMGFEAIKTASNGSVIFKHPSEKKSIGGYFWFSASPYTMHHPNSTKTVNIFESVRKMDAAKELLKVEINYDDKLLKFDTNSRVINTNQKFLKVTDEITESITEFLNTKDGLFSIRSPMGTGKSTIIGHLIQECLEEDTRVLIITNRISVARDFSKKYNLKLYNKDKYEIDDSLVVQYDSLWKYNIKNFDVIIMDEFISLMLHSRSNLSNSSVNIAKFLASFNKKLVIADAFLTGYENFLLNKKKEIFLLNNEYRDPSNVLMYQDQNYFMRTVVSKGDDLLSIIEKSNGDKRPKITISSTSIQVINELTLMLSSRGLKVVTLTAETPELTKDLIYGLFEKVNHDKWDVLIFSPTLTVGVSNINSSLCHFHYDSSMSTDVISSIQMVKRSRKAKEIHLYIKERINYIRTTYNEIRDEYMSNLGKNLDNNYLFEIDNYGEPRLSNIGRSAIKIDTFSNILEFNHKEAFLYLIKFHFLSEPKIIANTFDGNVLTKYKRIIQKDLTEINDIRLLNYLELSDINKMELLDDVDSDKILRALAEIDNLIEDAPEDNKIKILKLSLSDKSFIQKCQYFKCAYNFSQGVWDKSDINNLVHKAVMSGENDDIKFYNTLINISDIIKEEYIPKELQRNKNLKYILDKCGYSRTRINSPKEVGYRSYSINSDVLENYKYIKV